VRKGIFFITFIRLLNKQVLLFVLVNIEMQDLLKGCRRRDRKSQELLYRMFFGYGTSLAFHYVLDTEQSKAIYNESMLKVFNKIDELKNDSTFKSWLHRIIVNTTIDYQRSIKDDFLENEMVLDQTLSNELNAEDELFKNDILGLVQKIPTSYRTVFLLHILEGFTFHEISKLLNITEGGAKSLYQKAKLKLQVLITDFF